MCSKTKQLIFKTMVTINSTNPASIEELTKEGIIFICDENMNLKISEEDFKRIQIEFPYAMDDIFIID